MLALWKIKTAVYCCLAIIIWRVDHQIVSKRQVHRVNVHVQMKWLPLKSNSSSFYSNNSRNRQSSWTSTDGLSRRSSMQPRPSNASLPPPTPQDIQFDKELEEIRRYEDFTTIGIQ